MRTIKSSTFLEMTRRYNMAVTIYNNGKYRIHFDDDTTVDVHVGRDEDGLIAEVGESYILTANARILFSKKIVKVEKLYYDYSL